MQLGTFQYSPPNGGGSGGGGNTSTFPVITQTLNDGDNVITLPSSKTVINVTVFDPSTKFNTSVNFKQQVVPSSGITINIAGSIVNAQIYVQYI